MTERDRSATTSAASYRSSKMENDLSPRKTMLVLVIVVGCFAVLWPKVFYPMLVGSANQHIKPSPIDKTTGCCDVISETDVNTIKIMSEICGTIIKAKEDEHLTGKEIVQRCRQEVLETCGIDISVVLQEQVRLGQSVKQILDEVRSLNGSLCLKYNFGVAPWRLGVPHRITVKLAPDVPHIRQERPHHLRSELVHPAFRERGRAIPHPPASPSRPPPKIVEGRPGPVPGMRPTIGGAGHVISPSKQGTSSMSVIMPIYTVGIVIFFTYTLMRIIFKKQPEGVGGSLYPPIDPDPHFRKEVFESESSRLGARYSRDNISSKLVVNAMSALLDEVDQEIEARRKSNEVASQGLVNETLSNGDIVKSEDVEEQPTVKVLGMEMTASCEGGKKWSRPDSPVLPTSPPPTTTEPVPSPQEIYLERALPAQSHLLVADSAVESQQTNEDDPAVVLAGKMTLSVVSLDSENGSDEGNLEHHGELVTSIQAVPQSEHQQEVVHDPTEIQHDIQELLSKSDELGEVEAKIIEEINEPSEQNIEEPEYEIEEYELQPLILKRFDAAPVSQVRIEDLLLQNQRSPQSAVLSEQEEEEEEEETVQKPLIRLENDEFSHTVKVEELEKEVDDMIQEAIDSIEQATPVVETVEKLKSEIEEIDNSSQTLVGNISSSSTIMSQNEPPSQIVSESGMLLEELLASIKNESSPSTIIDESIMKQENKDSKKLTEQSHISNLEENSATCSETNEATLNTNENHLEANEMEKLTTKDGTTLTTEEQSNVATEFLPSLSHSEIKTELSSHNIQEITNEKLGVDAEIKSDMQENKQDDVVQKHKELQSLKVDEPSKVVEEKIQTDDRDIEQIETAKNDETMEPIEMTEKTEISQINLQESSKDVHIIKGDYPSEELSSALQESDKTDIKVENAVSEKNDKLQVNLQETVVQDTKLTENDGKDAPTQQLQSTDDLEKTEVKANVVREEIGESNIMEDEPSKPEQPIEILTDDDELGSDEELVEEIEEIVYEEETDEEDDIEDEVGVENRTESASVQRINGERSDVVEESKYTTVSGTTAAEVDISDEELTDNEEVEDDEEIIEVEEDEEPEDDDFSGDESNDVNHISGESEPEL